MNEILKIQDLCLWLQTEAGRKQILKNIDLSVSKGEIHGLIGESGCGKTMLTRSLLDLFDQRAFVSGKIEYCGEDLAVMPKKQRRSICGSRIGYITQDPLTALDPLYNVGEQIAEMLRYHKGIKKKEANERAVALLEKVGIAPGKEAAKRYPHQFSGGQLQRICLAMAVCCEPGLLIADEPTTALDVTTQAQIMELIRDLSENGTSVLIITHDFGVVAELCDRVSVMEEGRIVEEGRMTDLLNEPKKEYTRRLVESAIRKERAYE